jgi:hypothetical protein
MRDDCALRSRPRWRLGPIWPLDQAEPKGLGLNSQPSTVSKFFLFLKAFIHLNIREIPLNFQNS